MPNTNDMHSVPNIVDVRDDNRKRSRYENENMSKTSLTETVSEDEMDSSEVELDPVLSSTMIHTKKSRQSFSMATKIAWVKDYQSCPQGTNMRNWLANKNKAESARVSYASFRRWVTKLHNRAQEQSETFLPDRSKNEVARPHHEMEKVLVEFIRIRNRRLHADGKQQCSAEYIREKAKEFHEEMYGDDSPDEFKASNGWLIHFRDYYKELLDPELSKNYQISIPVCQAPVEVKEPSQLSESSVIYENVLEAYLKNEKSLTENKIKLLQQLMVEHSDKPP